MNPLVLVVDDDERFLAALERTLRLEGFETRTATGGREALRVLDQRDVALALVDVSMPDLDGITVIRHARARGLDVPICVLSARTEVADRVRGLQAGADDYLTKPFAISELVARIEALLRRRPPAPAEPLSVGDVRIDRGARRAWRGTRELELTRREFDLLEALARHAGSVVSRRRLLELVWGYTFEADTNVVDVFAGYLRRKLEAGGEPRIVHTERGVGFVLRADAVQIAVRDSD
jgi:two-component system response regulator PrrA